jgi:hypothetical protein
MTVQPKFSDAAVDAAMQAHSTEKYRWYVFDDAGTRLFSVCRHNDHGGYDAIEHLGTFLGEGAAVEARNTARNRAAMRAALEAAMPHALNDWPTDAMIAAGVATYENADPTEHSDSAMRMAWASMIKAAGVAR